MVCKLTASTSCVNLLEQQILSPNQSSKWGSRWFWYTIKFENHYYITPFMAAHLSTLLRYDHLLNHFLMVCHFNHLGGFQFLLTKYSVYPHKRCPFMSFIILTGIIPQICKSRLKLIKALIHVLKFFHTWILNTQQNSCFSKFLIIVYYHSFKTSANFIDAKWQHIRALMYILLFLLVFFCKQPSHYMRLCP